MRGDPMHVGISAIEYVPAGYDANGNPIPGAAIGRLVYFAPKGGGHSTSDPNKGDYSFRFHFHLTRP